MDEELYAELYPQFFSYCMSLTQDYPAAEDLVQETCVRALSHPEDLSGSSRGQCRSWLYKTARNLWIDRLRRSARETVAEPEQLLFEGFEEDLTLVAVRQLMLRLPPEERTLFQMRYFEGYNSAELGEMFDLPPATVRARLASARGRLRKWLNS